MPKELKEFYVDHATGKVSTEYNDDSTGEFNLADSIVLTPSGLTKGGVPLTAAEQAAVRGGVGATRFGNTVAIIGDSIAAAGWFPLLVTLSGTRMRFVKGGGIGGDTSAKMLARIQADVLSLRPAWTAIEGVTPNDPSQGLTVAQTVGNVKAMCATSMAAGSAPIIILGPPHNTPAINNHMRLASLLLAEWANNNDIPTFDIYTPLSDPNTGVYLAAYQSGDGTHPSRAGERAMADFNVPVAAQIFKPFSLQQTRVGDASNLFVNGLFLSDSNSDGLADSISKAGSGVTSLAPAGANGFGNWQVCAPGGSATQLYQDVPTIVGRTYEASAGVFCTEAATIRFRVPGADFPIDHGAFGPIAETAGAVVTTRFVATNATSRINLGANGASGQVGYRQVTVRDITALIA